MMATGDKPRVPPGSHEAPGAIAKTMRQFLCRDHTWNTCQQIADDYACSIDYIINEAMRFYARSKKYEAPVTPRLQCLGTPTPQQEEAQVYPPNTLFLIFEKRRYAITGETFTIGRGARRSDLPIRDNSISRKHAIVIRRHGTYYIKDQGSTNGIGYGGKRIDNKRIDEGDIFYICEHELRFTYR
jgi:hypothetical protein